MLRLKMQVYIFVFATLLRTAVPYSSGAPQAACGDMTPQHKADAQTSNAPYRILSLNSTITQNEKATIVIESAGKAFEGFFVQARDSGNSPIGVFLTPTYNTFSCGEGTNNAITHGDPSGRDKISFQWQPPSNFEGDITFKATIVQTSKIFWTNLASNKISVVKGSGVSLKQGENEAVPEQATSPQGLEKLVTNVYTDCGSYKTCFGVPAGCLEKKNCNSLSTFTKAGDKYEFELMGKRTSGGQYLAVGLSDDASMGDDAVVVCSAEQNGNMDIYNAFNKGKDSKKVVDLYKGLTTVRRGFTDDTMYCSFMRDASTMVYKRQFNLDAKTFHVLVAGGTVSGGVIRYHGGDNRASTAQPVALGSTSKLSANDDKLFKLIHGCLMIIAWISTATCGILLARYYKKTWVAAKCMNKDMWFHLHRFFMLTTWSLTVASFILIVYSMKDFRVHKHSIIGVVTVGLCFIQPFIAALRCHPGTPNRSIFNWLHWLIGTAALTLGIAAIFFGLEIFLGGDRHWVREVCWYILMAFIAFYILVHLMLSFSQCISDCKAKKSENVFPMKDLTDSRMALQPEDAKPDAPMSGFRKFIFGIYLPINWIATILLILLIVFKREDLEETFTSWGLPNFWENL